MSGKEKSSFRKKGWFGLIIKLNVNYLEINSSKKLEEKLISTDTREERRKEQQKT